jgi:hypothetical protein
MAKSKSEPTLEEKIRARAHEIWERAGRPEGQHLAHWQQAEAELSSNAAPRAARARKEPVPEVGPATARPRTAAPAKRGARKAAAE